MCVALENRMPATVQDLAAQAIALAPEDRARLADLLLASLPQEDEADFDVAWEQEIQRRVASIETGTAKLITSAEVHARAQKIIDR